MRSIKICLVIAVSTVLLSCRGSATGGAGEAGGQGGSGAQGGAGGTGGAGGSGGQGGEAGTGGWGGEGGTGGTGGEDGTGGTGGEAGTGGEGGSGGTGGEGGSSGEGGAGGSGSGGAVPVYLKPSNTNTQQRFGCALALSSDGSTLAVGADDEFAAANGKGEVFVFVRAGDTWVQQARLTASNPGVVDKFGRSIALSADGGTLAVGAPLEDSSATGIGGDEADDGANNSGAAYVFRRTGATWSQEAYVKASNTGAGDNFGWAIALSGDGATLAVGAMLESSDATGVNGDQADNSTHAAGAVYVFTYAGAVWSQQAYVKASTAGVNDTFGYSVSLSTDGATLAVGAPGESSAATGVDGDQIDDSAQGAGAAYVFTRAEGVWSQQAYLKASNAGQGDGFGSAVSIAGDGSTLAVGAPGEASSATGIDGNQADDSEILAGAAYVFSRTGIIWAQQVYLKASNTDSVDRFGNGVSLSSDGATLAIAAPNESSTATGLDGDQADNGGVGSGAVYLFERGDARWVQQQYVKASNTGLDDAFGTAVSLSAGGLLAVGAVYEDSSATGMDGDQNDNGAQDSGAAYLY